MINRHKHERGGLPDEARRGLRLVPSIVTPPPPHVNDELRDLIKRLQRSAKKRTPPSDDPPRAA